MNEVHRIGLDVFRKWKTNCLKQSASNTSPLSSTLTSLDPCISRYSHWMTDPRAASLHLPQEISIASDVKGVHFSGVCCIRTYIILAHINGTTVVNWQRLANFMTNHLRITSQQIRYCDMTIYFIRIVCYDMTYNMKHYFLKGIIWLQW